MRVGLDLDNCGYPFAEEFTSYASRRLGVPLPQMTHWNSYQKHWGLTHEQFNQLVMDAVTEGELWRNGDPLRGFVGATWALTDAGHTVVIATDRMQNTPHAREVERITRNWLYCHGAIYDELLFTADKREANADVFIDDRPQAIPALRLAGVDAVYYSRPWNEDFPYPRVSSWAEFVQYVEARAA